MANFKRTDEGIFIGPQPAEQDLREAKRLGIQTVIDMRMPGEGPTSNDEMTRCNGLGYVNIPVNKTALAGHQIDELEHVMERMPGPYLLHCATGARAALLLVLSRARQRGWTAERTFQEAQGMGFNLEDSDNFAVFVRETTVQ
ncbi:beta-lactamase hydrolase domain-containing protein [Massilia sp. TWR1-2-2]|uniref:beta-lactamase hydrolase domain-containing protein n=1 Tax=Massilia sp. TWR1-2-2 TaxID=2804584 RepID=UPI003CF875BC